MKVYAITLERIEERKHYINNHLNELNLDYQIIKAIDGASLSKEEMAASCDMKNVEKWSWWLTPGAIGCALSHYNAYEALVETNEKAGFVIEDDTILPENINELLNEIEQEIGENEIILLFYSSFNPANLSSVGLKKLADGNLVYPMETSKTFSALAYVIGRKAAQNMLNNIKPIRVTADNWHYYFQKGCFNSLRVHYPSVVGTKNFKSAIDYLKRNSLKARISSFIDKYQIPVFYQIVKYIRGKRLKKIRSHFSLVNEVSPVYEKKNSSEVGN